MTDAPLRGKIEPTWSRWDQIVEIHWRLADGSIFVERHTCPPMEIIKKISERDDK